MERPKYQADVSLLKRPVTPEAKPPIIHAKPEYDELTMLTILEYIKAGFTKESITQAYGFPRQTLAKWIAIHEEKEKNE